MKIQSVVDAVTADLRNRMIHGLMTSGQRIKEADVAKEFNTSRPSIREAFKILS